MTFLIQKDEPSNNSRRIPCRVFTSNGTSPDTGAVGDAVIAWLPSGNTISLSSALTAIHAAQGMYYQQLTQSEVSLLGPHALYHTVGDFPHHLANYEVVNNNILSTLSAISDVTLAAKEYSNVTVRIGLVDYSGASVGARDITPRSYSGVSVEVKTGGIQTASVGVGNYSGVSVGVLDIKPASYSGVSVGVLDIKPAAYSGVSVEVKTGGIQTTSVGIGSYSGVSVEVKTGGIQTASVGKGNYSGVSVEILTGGIQTTSIGAGTYSSVTFQGVTRVNSSVTPANAIYSGVTVRIDPVDYSGATVGINNIAPGAYSGVTVGIDNIKAASYSGVTIQGVTRLNSAVTLNADTHSGATIAGIVSGGIIAATLASGVLTSAKFAAGAIDAAALATDAGQEIADALLGRNIAGGSSTGRIVSEALYPLRNRSLIVGSVGTVYQVDDATSSWTFSPSLGTAPLSGIDPIGP